MSSLYGMVFIVLIVVIIFLVFQINENSQKCREVKQNLQEDVKKSARLVIQSATSNHPFFKLYDAVHAKILLDAVIESQGGVSAAEKTLKYSNARLNNLKAQVDNQCANIENMIMDGIVEQNNAYDIDINEEAGFRKRKRKSNKNKS